MVPDADGNTVSPDEISSSTSKHEELGKKIDRWTILNSLKKLSEQRSNGKETQLLVNITNTTLRDEHFQPWLTAAYASANLPCDALVFQFSETDATSYINDAKSFVEYISTQGGKCCITHFGCSLNPFKTLSHIDVAMVKVDNSFAADIQKKNESPEQLKEILTKINETWKQSIVPSVENATLLATLWQAGAHFIQGSYVQSPTDKMDFVFNEE
jgi:EAL domain-containing protein (putative c-di-GMP-specific phosphodiesterase class I)